MERTWFALGSALAALAVMTGAFAAHALRNRLSASDLDTFQTAARYHFFHALALLAVGYAATRWSTNLTTVSGWLFVAGIVLFSGSLYLLTISGNRALGAITPFGGAAFIAGWLLLAWAALRG